MLYTFRQYFLLREAENNPRFSFSQDKPKLSLFSPEEDKESDIVGKTTKSGRYQLKRSKKVAKPLDWLFDQGVNVQDLNAPNDLEDRLTFIMMKEEVRDIPFVSWVVGDLKNRGYENMDQRAIWNHILMGMVSRKEIEDSLKRIKRSDLGDLSYDEFMKLIKLVKWTPPVDERHWKELGAKNGMITPVIAKKMLGIKR